MQPGSLRSRLAHGISLLAGAGRMLASVPSARERLRLVALTARAFLRVGSRQPGLTGRLVPAPQIREYELRPEAGAPRLRLRSDDLVLMEVYGGRPYELDYGPIGEVHTILDLGANVGLASAFLSARFPGARLVAVEPNPATFELLEENLRRLGAQAVAVRAAVVDKPGRYRLEPGRAPSGDQIVRASDGVEPYMEAMTLNQLLDRHAPEGVDLIKMDVEGAEAALFAQAPEWAERVGAVVAEVHPPLERGECLRMLAAAGFEPLPVPSRTACEHLLFASRVR